jgi:hypothetical protein
VLGAGVVSLLHRVNRLWANVRKPHVVPGWLDMADDGTGRVLVRWMANLPDNTNAAATASLQVGRLWVLTDDMSDSRILNTFLLAMLTFMEHEVKEGFTFYGRHIYMPHH